MPVSQHGVRILRYSSLGGRCPETLALEGVTGYGDFSPLFTREKSLEINRQARPVRLGYGGNKGMGPFRLRTVKGGAEDALQYQRGVGNP